MFFVFALYVNQRQDCLFYCLTIHTVCSSTSLYIMLAIAMTNEIHVDTDVFTGIKFRFSSCLRITDRKAAILYGSSAPEVSGNVDDYVAEMLDMVTEEDAEALDEREVVILRDVDDSVAQEVVEVIGKMSKEEADQQGGKSALFKEIKKKINLFFLIMFCKIAMSGDYPVSTHQCVLTGEMAFWWLTHWCVV